MAGKRGRGVRGYLFVAFEALWSLEAVEGGIFRGRHVVGVRLQDCVFGNGPEAIKVEAASHSACFGCAHLVGIARLVNDMEYR